MLNLVTETQKMYGDTVKKLDESIKKFDRSLDGARTFIENGNSSQSCIDNSFRYKLYRT